MPVEPPPGDFANVFPLDGGGDLRISRHGQYWHGWAIGLSPGCDYLVISMTDENIREMRRDPDDFARTLSQFIGPPDRATLPWEPP